MEALIRVSDVDEVMLGHGHSLAPIHDQQGRLVGWLHTHPDARTLVPDARPCQSFVSVRAGLGSPILTILRSRPLSLDPAVSCHVCGAQGLVIEGRWEPVGD